MPWIKKFAGRFGHVHFMDNDGTQRVIDGRVGTSKHQTIGDGNVDLKAILQELYNQGYDSWIEFDLWDIPDIFRAAFVGRKKLDAMMDEIFSG